MAATTTIKSPSKVFSGRWRDREWNDAECTCPVCGRDIGEDYHQWDNEDGTHAICEPIDRHLNAAGTAISEDDFEALFGVQLNPAGDLFDYPDIATTNAHHVWTIVEGDDANLYACPGVHVVNRLGFIITERPWDVDIPDAEWDIHDDAGGPVDPDTD